MAVALYDPKQELWGSHPAMQALVNARGGEIDAAAKTLQCRERKAVDTSYARTALYEAIWWLNCTADVSATTAALDRLQKALHCADPPSGLTQDDEGSFAVGSTIWYLKLDRSTDQLLARDWPWRRPPSFLESINGPARMVTYLLDRCWSDVYCCGRDNRTELNEALSVIARLVAMGGQAGYLTGPNFYPALARFITDWQDPATGFFGETYILRNGDEIRTNDLSLTFHMAHYVPHLISGWPRLIDTLLTIKDLRYPQGWLEGSKLVMTDHNNYDVVELFYRAWPYMRGDQRRLARQEIRKMVDWCLAESIDRKTGEVKNPDNGDPIADAYYFSAAFLATLGFFDPTQRFWTDDATVFADADAIQQGMVDMLRTFDPDYTGVDDALEQLGAKTRPWSNAML